MLADEHNSDQTPPRHLGYLPAEWPELDSVIAEESTSHKKQSYEALDGFDGLGVIMRLTDRRDSVINRVI